MPASPYAIALSTNRKVAVAGRNSILAHPKTSRLGGELGTGDRKPTPVLIPKKNVLGPTTFENVNVYGVTNTNHGVKLSRAIVSAENAALKGAR
jgi:hypothetical protein